MKLLLRVLPSKFTNLITLSIFLLDSIIKSIPHPSKTSVNACKYATQCRIFKKCIRYDGTSLCNKLSQHTEVQLKFKRKAKKKSRQRMDLYKPAYLEVQKKSQQTVTAYKGTIYILKILNIHIVGHTKSRIITVPVNPKIEY